MDKVPGTPKDVMRQAIVAEAVHKRKQTAVDASAIHVSTAHEAAHSRQSPSMERRPCHTSSDHHSRQDGSSPSWDCYSRYRSPSRDSRDCTIGPPPGTAGTAAIGTPPLASRDSRDRRYRSPSRESRDHRSPSDDPGRWSRQGHTPPSRERRPSTLAQLRSAQQSQPTPPC